MLFPRNIFLTPPKNIFVVVCFRASCLPIKIPPMFRKKIAWHSKHQGPSVCVAHISAAGGDFVYDPIADMYSLKLCIRCIVL